MTSSPVLNPELPYVGEVEGGMTPGKMVKIQGNVPPESSRFAINYQLGPNLNPRDDIAIHVSPRFHEGFITRNHIESMTWGQEENEGGLWIKPGSHFEIILLCEYNCYKIAVNGRHFAEFNHRLPYSKVTHLTIDGEVEISSIFYETLNIGSKPSAPVPDVPPVNVGPPPPGGLYPTLNPEDFPNPQNKYGPPPGGYRNNPPAQPYRQKTEEEEDAYGSCLDKVGLAVGGLVAAGGVAAAMHAYNKNKKKQQQQQESGEYHEKTERSENESGLNLGVLGAALASSLASGAFDRNAHAQQGYPPQNSGSGMLGSILGALGGGGGMHPQGGYQQPAQPQPDPLGGLGSILGGVLGGGGHHQQQPQYQPSGGYGSGPGYQQSQGGDLFGGLGGALFSAAMDGLTKKSHKSQPHFGGGGGDQDYSNYNPHPPPPSRSDHDQAPPPSYAQHRPPSPPPPGGGKLSAAEISKGLGLGDDDD